MRNGSKTNVTPAPGSRAVSSLPQNYRCAIVESDLDHDTCGKNVVTRV
jgi:hypothetical protein